MKEASEQQAEYLLAEALDKFRCYKDADIESFLRKKAIDFETRGYCSVYLLLDELAFEQGQIFVQAYFTLSHKSIAINPEVSKTTRGKISTHREADLAHFVLIGQLGKYMEEKNEGKTDLCAENILDDAFDMIEKSSDIIVCRGALVECNSEEKVHMVYKKYGFAYLQFDDAHYQFYKRVKNS